MKLIKYYLLLIVFLFSTKSYSQCVNSYPYTQDFELNTGNWVSGGTLSDWTWGTPNKAFITNAGSGTKCWVTGGLTGSSYNLGERSFVQSPCFDFSTLAYPFIQFKIYWECENIFDGATFQYSVNGGTTWLNLGTSSDPIDCLNQNWFNQNNITNLTTLATPKHGWAGSQLPTSGACQGGGGSNGWVTAKHCMSNLAGQPNVIFRFAFGAGTNCNAYDGVAFDNIWIGEAPSNVASFTYACTGNANEYQFTNTSILCPTNYSWNFGDLSAGANNFSNSPNPNHTFTTPGTYTVSLTTSGPCNAPSTTTQTIVTIVPTTTIVLPCFGNTNGSITTTAANGTGTYSYTLMPVNTTNTTGIFNTLPSNIYTITVSDASLCKVSTTVNLQQLNPLIVNNIALTNPLCNGNKNGSILYNASGGTGSYSYNLQPQNITNTTGVFTNLSAGVYTTTVTDAQGCTASTINTIVNPTTMLWASVTKTDIDCFGNGNGSVHSFANNGTGTITYVLYPQVISNTSGIFTNLNSAVYIITATDANGCSISTTTQISEPTKLEIANVLATDPTCNINNNGTITVNASGATLPYTYTVNGTMQASNLVSNLVANMYSIVVTDSKGCTTSTMVLLNPPVGPVIDFVTIKNATCYQKNDGSLAVIASSIGVNPTYALLPTTTTNTNGIFNDLLANTYTVIVTDGNFCSASSIVTIAEPEEIKVLDFQIKNVLCSNEKSGSILLNASSTLGSITYSLLPTNVTNTNGFFDYLTIGKYTVVATDVNNCSISREADMRLGECCENIIVPNAFSPNNDTKNDVYTIKAISDITLGVFKIYNRWGNEVFSTTNSNFGWDGNYKEVPVDANVYYYMIKYTCNSNKKTYVKKGDITLIR